MEDNINKDNIYYIIYIMVEHIITDKELIVFLTCNRENLDMYTEDYFNQFNIQFNMSVIRKWEHDGVIKGGEGEPEPTPQEIKMPYKFFYDKLDYLKKVAGSFFTKLETTQETPVNANEPKESSMYNFFEKGLNLNIFKSDAPLEEPKPNIEKIDDLKEMDKTEHPAEEPYNGVLSLNSLKVDADKKEEPVQEEEKPVIEEEPVVEEEEEPVVEEEDVINKDEIEKLKLVFALDGEPAIKIEKSTLYKTKQLIPFIKYLLKNGFRWENMDGFMIGEKPFIIGDYVESCAESSSKFYDPEIENTELYKLIKESECA